MAPKRRVQVVSRRLSSSPGYYPDIATIPKRAHPTWHHHWAVRVEKSPSGGIHSVPDTWDYFGLARHNNTSTVVFDASSFHPEKVRDWGHTEMGAEDIRDIDHTLIGKWGKYNVVTSNCQDYVDNLARIVSNKWWRMSSETSAKVGMAGAVLGALVAIL
ncbi:hypothetical protein BJX63DRAFT_211233 [Aspergillus granulosus]|uniref:LRAT domain-containing protein n=1 Tax=Aspergillus granulosus TaxID=176169 RepID=A0ABR4HE47_9EURO